MQKLASFENDKQSYREHIPIVDPQNNQLVKQEIVRQGGAQAVYQIRQIVAVQVIENVLILEDQSRSHHHRPEQFEPGRRVRPHSGEVETDFHRSADGTGRYHRVRLRFRLSATSTNELNASSSRLRNAPDVSQGISLKILTWTTSFRPHLDHRRPIANLFSSYARKYRKKSLQRSKDDCRLRGVD